MYRIRFHGRGGQGMKTASRILGTTFFNEGYQVQDAPRYGAERRGAPIFAYVRASRKPINERGIITRPDLVVVADDSLLSIPAAGASSGLSAASVLLINSHDSPELWRGRLKVAAFVLVLPAWEEAEDRAELPFIGAACAGASARLVGVLSRECLERAICEELAELPKAVIERNLTVAAQAYERMADQEGIVTEGSEISAAGYQTPEWIEPPFEDARVSAPAIHAGLTSVEVRTGLWRTLRPEIEYERCNHCWWVCSTFCPDSAISVSEQGAPVIDYDHCKGCMICVAKCPPHAIVAIPEHEAQAREREGEAVT